MKELWKPVSGFNNYEISNHGRLRSIDRLITDCRGRTFNKKGRVIVPLKSNGYNLFSIKGSFVQYAHRLVASTFIRLPKTKEEVNHKDGDRANNYVENLEWCTKAQNGQHAYDVLKRNMQDYSVIKKAISITNISTGEVREFDSLKTASTFFDGRYQTIQYGLKKGIYKGYAISRL